MIKEFFPKISLTPIRFIYENNLSRSIEMNMEKCKVIKNLLEYKLKFIHNYDFMSLTQKIDYEDDISSIIPYEINEEFVDKFLIFNKNIENNAKHSIVSKYLKQLFGES
jgi:16S rRNA A1518/A1519 N6-dimethyltransferase RsmA/KsgA/DIM1 with predicted DNA glycosylase/AP lyase activity